MTYDDQVKDVFKTVKDGTMSYTDFQNFMDNITNKYYQDGVDMTNYINSVQS